MRRAAFAVCLLLVAHATTAQERHAPHVRAESGDVRQLIADAADKSVTFRALLDGIERSDLIVYVRMRVLPSETLDGRIGFLGARAQTRFLAIELACPRRRDIQTTTLAHELQHATEIAGAPWVTGAATLARLYAEIGRAVTTDPWSATYETTAAQEMGRRVRDELQRVTAPSAVAAVR